MSMRRYFAPTNIRNIFLKFVVLCVLHVSLCIFVCIWVFQYVCVSVRRMVVVVVDDITDVLPVHKCGSRVKLLFICN